MMLLRSLLILAIANFAFSHVFKSGACPEIDVVENFTFEKFTGKWHVIEKSQTTSSCMTYNFTVKDDGSLAVLEKYRLFGLKIFNNWNDISQTGQLKVPSGVPAKMTVQFPFSLNPFSPTSFWVVATDYDNYAAIWSCRRFLFGHFQSGMILGRNATLDRVIVNKMRNRFEYFGVDRSDFSVVDQSGCADKIPNPIDEVKNILTNATNLRPSVVVTVANDTDIIFASSSSANGLVSYNESTVAKEIIPTTEKASEPQDIENMF